MNQRPLSEECLVRISPPVLRDRQHVRVVFLQRVLGDQEPRPKVTQVNMYPPVLHSVPQHIQDPTRVDLVGDPDRKRLHRSGLIPAMHFDQLLEPLNLRLPDELPQFRSGKPKLRVIRPGASDPPSPQQFILDPLLKRELGMRSRTHTVIPPVTAAVISACRRSARTASCRSIEVVISNAWSQACRASEAILI